MFGVASHVLELGGFNLNEYQKPGLIFYWQQLYPCEDGIA